MPKFDLFDLIAPWYDRGNDVSRINEFIEYLELPTSGILLDVGGGTGRIARSLVGFVPKIIVADSSIGMLNQAKKEIALTTVRLESENLAFANSSIERIIMVDAFHHVRNQPRTLAELWRVLKPGGILLINEPDYTKIKIKILAVIEKLLLMRSHFLTHFEIVNRVKKIPGLKEGEAKIKTSALGDQAWIMVKRNPGEE
jgi:ubiquinone/menaquinone biosynthesis C-methylase UbiE